MVIIEATDPWRWTVTFVLEVEDAGATSVVGTFNDWDPSSDPFLFVDVIGRPVARVDVAPGTVVRFRYLSERLGWLDDDTAHERWPNDHGTLDNVVFVPVEAPAADDGPDVHADKLNAP